MAHYRVQIHNGEGGIGVFRIVLKQLNRSRDYDVRHRTNCPRAPIGLEHYEAIRICCIRPLHDVTADG